MAKLRVGSFSISIDGLAAGPDQSLENRPGIGGLATVCLWWVGFRAREKGIDIFKPIPIRSGTCYLSSS